MTEVGPVAVEAADGPGTDRAVGADTRTGELYLLECDYIGEVVDPATGEPVAPGSPGELVLTNLNRVGSPLIRYRTGDLVRIATEPDPAGRTWRRFSGGILGRSDDMIHVRGNNLYPSAIEAIVRRFEDVAEFRINVDRANSLADVRLEIEPVRGDGAGLAEAVGRAVRNELLFRIEVTPVPPGTLPRFELKARRIVRTET
jgi:phenylacetate-CoA ligase